MEYQFRALEHWPGQKTRSRKMSRFRTNWASTIDLLERELKFLRARNVVIQADVDASEIRLDGMLRANARVRSPAIVLSFDSIHGPLSYPCDSFDDWHDNVRAIALGLDALRAVDRYGVTRRAEQYKGWARLPDPNANARVQSPDDAKRLIESIIGKVEWRHPFDANAIFRAKIKSHPDQGGSADLFKSVVEAAGILGIAT